MGRLKVRPDTSRVRTWRAKRWAAELAVARVGAAAAGLGPVVEAFARSGGNGFQIHGDVHIDSTAFHLLEIDEFQSLHPSGSHREPMAEFRMPGKMAETALPMTGPSATISPRR